MICDFAAYIHPLPKRRDDSICERVNYESARQRVMSHHHMDITGKRVGPTGDRVTAGNISPRDFEAQPQGKLESTTRNLGRKR